MEEEIDKAFVSTLAKTMLQVSNYVASSEGSTTAGLTDTVQEKLEKLDGDMTTYITILESYISIIDAATSLTEATDKVTDQLDTTSDLMRINIGNAKTSIYSISDMTNSMLNQVDNVGRVGSSQVDSLMTAVTSLHELYNTNIRDTVSLNTEIDNEKKSIDTDLTAIENDLNALKATGDVTSADAKALIENLNKDMEASKRDIDNLYETYNNTIDPQLNNTMNSIQASMNEIQQILNYSSDSIDDVSRALNSYPEMMGFGKDKLTETLNTALDMQSKLRQLIADVDDLENNHQYATLMKLIETDPAIIADFISSPVNLDEKPIYYVANNGSATAPFYIILSIWFGALILIAIVHSTLKTVPAGCVNLMNYQKFFGRYMVFYFIGQIQTIITVLGCLLFVGIQCEHPFMFWLAASITSFTFTLFMYSLSYAFGNVGEAAAVVLLVIQVAGSGGTFPVEVLPIVFQYMYKYMPFAYGMNAIRETIAGFHGKDYWLYLGGMGIYVLVALLFGLIISIPCAKLNKMIEESKENTDLLV